MPWFTEEEKAKYRRGTMLAALGKLWDQHPDLSLGHLMFDVEPDRWTMLQMDDARLHARIMELYHETPAGKKVQEALTELVRSTEEMGGYDSPQERMETMAIDPDELDEVEPTLADLIGTYELAIIGYAKAEAGKAKVAAAKRCVDEAQRIVYFYTYEACADPSRRDRRCETVWQGVAARWRYLQELAAGKAD